MSFEGGFCFHKLAGTTCAEELLPVEKLDQGLLAAEEIHAMHQMRKIRILSRLLWSDLVILVSVTAVVS